MKPKKMFSLLVALLVTHSALSQGTLAESPAPPESEEHPVKYAIYSAAWSVSSNAGLRLVAQNQSDAPIQLNSIRFRDEQDSSIETTLEIDLTIPAHGWAEYEMPYTDLLFGNECVARTMGEDWELVEISNYTLNPSVRGLIIEDSDSFRIYQCVRNVMISTLNEGSGEGEEYMEWVMYHFERRTEF